MKTTDLRVTDTAGNHQFAIVDDSTGQDIALVYNRSEDSKETAQLLAAAPELLNIALSIFEDIQHGTINAKNGISTGSYTYIQLTAAIQKATNP